MLTRRFVRLHPVSRRVEADLEAIRADAEWASVTIPPELVEVTTHPAWAGLGSMLGGTLAADGTFTPFVPPPRRDIAVGTFLERLTVDEHTAMEQLANTRPRIRAMLTRLLATGRVGLDRTDLVDFLAYLKTPQGGGVGVNGMWPDVATADARIAALRADG